MRQILDLDQETWDNIDAEFNTIQAPLHHLLGMNEIVSDVAMDQYSELLTTFLASKPQFQKEAVEYFIQAPPATIPEERKKW